VTVASPPPLAPGRSWGGEGQFLGSYPDPPLDAGRGQPTMCKRQSRATEATTDSPQRPLPVLGFERTAQFVESLDRDPRFSACATSFDPGGVLSRSAAVPPSRQGVPRA
jgi:hypothetical protein